MGKVTFMDAIISGKVGGQVYSRNKAGFYVRQWVKPINPRTVAQITARTSFGNVSNRYHMLTNTQKANWNAFAPFYNPKGVSVPSGISGFNAFIALNNLVNKALQNPINADVLKNNAGVNIVHTQNNFIENNNAPSGQLITSVSTTSGAGPLIIDPIASAISFEADGNFDFNLVFNQIAGPTVGIIEANPFTDTHGFQYGFMAYMSNGVQQSHNFKANPEIQCLFSIPNFNITTTTTGWTKLGLTGAGSIDPASYQKIPNSNDIVQVTLYQVGMNGMCNKILTKDIVVGA